MIRPGTFSPRRAVGLVFALVVLYYLVTATVQVNGLRGELSATRAESAATALEANAQRDDLLQRLDTLQADLEAARAEVEALRQQLIQEGLTPVQPTTHDTGGSQ
jgi:F0F1-type ATP synthase membrane subunit b/b'